MAWHTQSSLRYSLLSARTGGPSIFRHLARRVTDSRLRHQQLRFVSTSCFINYGDQIPVEAMSRIQIANSLALRMSEPRARKHAGNLTFSFAFHCFFFFSRSDARMPQVSRVCDKFREVCISEGRASEALATLRSAALKMGRDTSSLTPIHPEFLQVHTMASCKRDKRTLTIGRNGISRRTRKFARTHSVFHFWVEF